MRTTNVISLRLAISLVLAAYPFAPAGGAEPKIQPSDIRVHLVEFATGIDSHGQLVPTDFVPLPGASGRLAVATLGGKIRLFDAFGAPLDRPDAPYLDANSISSRERGTTAVAFHPDFSTPGQPGFGKMYSLLSELPGTGAVDFRAVAGGSNHQQVLVEWSTETPQSDTPTFRRRDVIRFDQSLSVHNVNDLTFDDEGLLLIPCGTEGATTQDLGFFQGAILRIDPLDPATTDRDDVEPSANGRYGVPRGNPFATSDGEELPEIYAYGFRNPYRLDFDRETGDLYVGDVGEAMREEVDRVELGKNYGWPYLEGTRKYLGRPRKRVHLVPPIFEYSRFDEDGETVIGGFVYRGQAIPELRGRYVFADFGRQVAKRQKGTPARLFEGNLETGEIHEIQSSGESIVSQFIFGFGQDLEGELYVLVGEDPVFAGAENPAGRILKILPATRGKLPIAWIAGAALVLCLLAAGIAWGRRG